MDPETKEIDELEAQERLAQLLNDSPLTIKVGGETMCIRALKPGVEAMIAEESVRIQKAQQGNMVDLMKRMSELQPTVVKCITLAILNDKDRIFSDYRRRQLSEEYESMYERVMWESDRGEWLAVLLGIFRLMNLDFFFHITEAVQNFRKMTLEKRTKGQSS